MSDVHPLSPWLLNQVPLIPIGTTIEGLFRHSVRRGFPGRIWDHSSRLNSRHRIDNPVRSMPPGQLRMLSFLSTRERYIAQSKCASALSMTPASPEVVVAGHFDDVDDADQFATMANESPRAMVSAPQSCRVRLGRAAQRRRMKPNTFAGAAVIHSLVSWRHDRASLAAS